MLGATVFEKHFTLNRAMKGTDHNFSLEPPGLLKQVRDLRRVEIAMGSGKRILYDFEKEARDKMGKGIYTSKPLSAGTIITMDDIFFKTPANGTPPYVVDKILGKRLKVDLAEELPIPMEYLE